MTSDPPPSAVRFGRGTFDRATRLGDPRRRAGALDAEGLRTAVGAEAPRVVSKEELHRRVWPDSFVSDASLLGLVKEGRDAPVVPPYLTFHGLAGLRPLVPGFARIELRPQLADLADLGFTAHTMRGPIRFVAGGATSRRELTVSLSPDGAGEILLRREDHATLDRAAGPAPAGHLRYRLPPGASTRVVT